MVLDGILATPMQFVAANDAFERLSGRGLSNPLLRAGLALRRRQHMAARRCEPPAAGNGVLTAEEVSGLDLSGTELVVLSACQTGLGEVEPGEGVFGFRRSFVLAGARTVRSKPMESPRRADARADGGLLPAAARASPAGGGATRGAVAPPRPVPERIILGGVHLPGRRRPATRPGRKRMNGAGRHALLIGVNPLSELRAKATMQARSDSIRNCQPDDPGQACPQDSSPASCPVPAPGEIYPANTITSNETNPSAQQTTDPRT